MEKLGLTNTVAKKKVLVGMSGGVDSTVTACLLQQQGYEVIGIHLRFWTDPTVFTEDDLKKFPQNKCCTLDGLTKTRQIANRLGIPFYVLNFEESFKKNVVDVFIDGYAKGVTPNPCIECNRSVKFGFFLTKMKELGADFIATGHYARKVTIKDGDNERYELWAAKDKTKDQSYFLYTLTQEKLKHILFPIGEYTKPEVRALATKFGVDEVNHQKESQNLCFFPEAKPTEFLRRYLKQMAFQPGEIVTTEGKKIGTHKGLPNYTIGQRKGLNIGGVKGFEHEEGQGWYVVQLDQKNNKIIVGREKDLFSKQFKAHTLTFVDGSHPENILELDAKIRYRFPQQPAKINFEPGTDQDSGTIEFTRPQRAITAGQSVVFYKDEKILGGGIIA